MKKIFIKICKLICYEIIDQNSFSSPTLNKVLNEELSTLNQKSIILPLGEVKITRKVQLGINNFNEHIIEKWDQNRKRLFEFPKLNIVIIFKFTLNQLNF